MVPLVNASWVPGLDGSGRFDGLDFGLFYTGYPNFLVGYSRFADCTNYGCGVDGGDGKKGVPAAPQGSPTPPDLPNAESAYFSAYM